MTDTVKVQVRTNGPFLITGAVELVDAEGKAWDLAGKTTFALCRCGASKIRPFCDGAHKTCGFESSESAPSE